MINKRLKNLSRFCSEIEKIENYDKAITDMDNMWDCHHRLEIGKNGEVVSREQLKRYGLYYHRPPEELIFLTHSEHTRLHTLGNPSPHKGKTLGEETRRKLREAIKAYWAKRRMTKE